MYINILIKVSFIYIKKKIIKIVITDTKQGIYIKRISRAWLRG